MKSLAVLLVLACVLPGVAVATKAYRWKDADGVVHIQDQPHEGAEVIELGTVQTYRSPPVPDTPSAPAQNPRTAQAGYQQCVIASPADDETLFETESITVNVTVQPALSGQDQVWLSYDGQAIAPQSPGSTSFVISPVDRGTHTVVASVRSASGASLCQGTPISFHVRQPSALSPQNPLRPRAR